MLLLLVVLAGVVAAFFLMSRPGKTLKEQDSLTREPPTSPIHATAASTPKTATDQESQKTPLPSVRLIATFDDNLNAREGAANPFPAAGNIDIVSSGKQTGGAARFLGQEDQNGHPKYRTEKSAMIWDGANLPVARGTIAFDMRWAGRRNWSDGKKTWLAVLPPDSTQVDGSSNGTGLVLYKDSDNSLVLGVYHLWKRHIRGETIKWGVPTDGKSSEIAAPDAIAARIPVGDLSADEWVSVRLSWDRDKGKVWLGVDDQLVEADADLRLPSWNCLLLGSPPSFHANSSDGFDGDLTKLVVDERTPGMAPQAGREIPSSLPPAASPASGRIPAEFLADDPAGAPLESALRSHLNQILRAQGSHGGWQFSVAWPSGLSFLSSQTVLPYSKNFFNGCKDDNSASPALRLLAGYLTLGNPEYLEGAERTGQALLRLQQPLGYWPYYAMWNPETKAFDSIETPDVAPLEDHVQSYPILLLWLLHDLTGKPEYKDAADHGLAFILHAQNPNGSWSHQFHPSINKGWTFSALDAGEINDYTTSDQMLVMLVAYRRSGDPKYLASYLRAADWLVDAFIEKGAVGWAQQYDADNKPIQARHFEPAAISLEVGQISAPERLLEAYHLTRDPAYLKPLLRWREWMLANKVVVDEKTSLWGWYPYYDTDTGKPFRMENFKRLPADPRNIRTVGYQGFLTSIEKAEAGKLPAPGAGALKDKAHAILRKRKAENLENSDPSASKLRPNVLLDSFNFNAGSWLFENTPWGSYWAPSTIRASLLCWDVFLQRMVAGQIPMDHKLAALNRDEFSSPVYFLVPPDQLQKPLTEGEIAAARKIQASR